MPRVCCIPKSGKKTCKDFPYTKAGEVSAAHAKAACRKAGGTAKILSHPPTPSGKKGGTDYAPPGDAPKGKGDMPAKK